MKIIDLSQPISDGGPNCPAHPPIRFEMKLQHPQDDWQLELFTFAAHTGSHIDAPLHRLADGASIDSIPLERFVGPAYIADLRPLQPKEPITEAKLAAALPHPLLPDSIVLLATGWGDIRERSQRWLYEAPKIVPSTAEWLVAQKVRGIGIDHWGIGGWDAENDKAVHAILLKAGIWIVEELRLPPEVCNLPSPQLFMALPIHLKAASGAWCRPVLLVSDDTSISLG